MISMFVRKARNGILLKRIDKYNFQFARERYGERMRILYELSWLWETLVIALAGVVLAVIVIARTPMPL